MFSLFYVKRTRNAFVVYYNTADYIKYNLIINIICDNTI